VRRLLFILPLFLLLAACGREASPAGTPGGRRVEEQAVLVTRLERTDVDEHVRVSGRLEGITDITMSSESSGRVLALFKKLGDDVQMGERIGHVENEVLESRLISAQAAEVSAQQNYVIASDNYEYALAASDRGLISSAEFKAADSAYRAAEAALNSARANASAAGLAYESSYLIAPVSGKISQLYVSPGQYLGMGSPVAAITDSQILILKSGVGESQIGKIKTGQNATVLHSGKSYPAKVRGYGIRPMPATASYPVELELRGNSGLLPGMVVSARIKTNTYRNLLVTPITNIVREFDQDYVFVVVENEEGIQVVERREVSLGRSISENVEILSGVEAGDLIVSSGSENLEDGSAVKIRQ